jgi:hypothetical protein
MSDTDQRIEPALTPAQWEEVKRGYFADIFDGFVDLDIGTIDIRLGGPAGLRDDMREIVALFAVLNHRLPDSDPRKLTWADVDACRDIGDTHFWNDSESVEVRREVGTRLATLAAKLTSLLPPR